MTEVEPPIGTVLRDEDGRVFVRRGQGWNPAGSRAEVQWRDLTAAYGPLVRLASIAEVAEEIAAAIEARAFDVSLKAMGQPDDRTYLDNHTTGLEVAARIAREYAAKGA